MRLGDAFPNKSLHARKTELGKGQIQPKTEIDYLVITLRVGSKRARGELAIVINSHNEASVVESRFPKCARRKAEKIRNWK